MAVSVRRCWWGWRGSPGWRGQREEKEREHLGPVQVHRQDHPSEVPGRQRSGILKGFDPLLNLVLDGTIEYMRGTSPGIFPHRLTATPLLPQTPTTSTSSQRTRGSWAWWCAGALRWCSSARRTAWRPSPTPSSNSRMPSSQATAPLTWPPVRMELFFV
ncbi:U6 snRNA-associated Sm-like protein LSm7 isoform X1 [Bubalus bubalis]|uniref:U6 snRNA-associated Sm-like protein LSm7 isoform X1 n=1 Tax=Bubalus bubalis TaxID=89462 RepID=UPI001D12222F|nr:U6 snRNA-associated Sm-like protein LSm7 isoform X1 [Bubalus bubalis]